MMWRSKLAHLSDEELAERYKRAWENYEEADQRRRSKSFFWKKRRTEDLPLPVRFWTAFNGSPGFRFIKLSAILGMLNGVHLSDEEIRALKPTDEVDDTIDSIQSIMDEMQRRVDRRKKAS